MNDNKFIDSYGSSFVSSSYGLFDFFRWSLPNCINEVGLSLLFHCFMWTLYLQKHQMEDEHVWTRETFTEVYELVFFRLTELNEVGFHLLI